MEADIGRPVGAKAQVYDEDIPRLYIREFTNGWAVYNHSGEAQAMGTDKRQGDVNGDGVINVFDLVFVANQF